MEAFADAFVNHRETKIAIWSEHPVRFDRGQHMLVDGPQIRDPLERQIFHLPLRAQSEITKRALNYEARRRALREDDAVSWQSRFHEKATLDGLSASVWAANSADRAGRLDVYGRPEELVRDVRLRRLLLAAALHIALRYRMLPA
ncbi:hypothetical protein [Ancylobacter sp. G4_0304]|uniref:hypothetical protein n=1 Tax=Ancylobacter sp. G4_0304 TaxID=3114289 RepID=UPI0039C6C70E